ncbi:MAG TPA: NADP-dependent oxidoreductase [Candidatus Saccharimonadales bacterium]|nr:NADP-dependent oxidoreductase [Candidatus Saccharimonadales bacterium]
MKAAQIKKYGDASVVEIVEVSRPSVREDQVLVEMTASSLNPFDTALREGYVPGPLPMTLGGDVAGVVIEVGSDVTTLTTGDHVYGQAYAIAGNSGAFAEYVASVASQIAKAPSNLSLQEAAALPLVGASALQGITEHIKLQANQKVFIHGGTGGIGSIAIQIAKHIGAYVATTATGEGLQLATQLGADEVIDYKAKDFAEQLHDFDAVFDTVGGDDFTKSFGILKKGGIAVTMIAQPDEDKAKALGVTVVRQMTDVTADQLDQLRPLIEDGVVTARIGKVFPLEDIREAFAARESHSVSGKIVIEIKAS